MQPFSRRQFTTNPTTCHRGPQFRPTSPGAVTVLGRYLSGAIAALVAPYGRGSIGLVGPHPEADKSWYSAKLVNPDGIDYTPGYDLISAAWNARG